MDFSAKEIQIYQTPLNKYYKNLKIFESILSEDELQKAYRFKFEKDKNNYISGRGILREILGKYLDTHPSEVKFTYTEKGKPFIENSKIKFNLSHSNGYAVYAFALEKEIGIDIEFVREMPDALEIAERFFSKEEVDTLKEISKDKIKFAFFNCWTRKEAFIKAIGDGLSYPLKNFSVSLKPGDDAKVFHIKGEPEGAMQWTLVNISSKKNFIASLAVKAKDLGIVYKPVE